MGEKEFEREVLDRLAIIETKIDPFLCQCHECQKTITEHSVHIAEIALSAKSAHHRIDGIFWGAGILGGIAGTVVNLIASALSKGGH